MSFNLGNYVEVKDRIAAFWEQYPNGRIVCEHPQPVEIGGRTFVASHALVWTDATQEQPTTTGSAWEQFPGQTPYTKNSEAMNAETSAIGRALGALGIGITGSLATSDEVRNRQAERDVPQIPDGESVAAAKKRIIDAGFDSGTAKEIWEAAALKVATVTIGEDSVKWVSPDEVRLLESVILDWGAAEGAHDGAVAS